jgi:Flp pilus assembly protein TadG
MRTEIHNRRGVTLIWVVIMLMLFIGFVGLATDTLWATLVNHQLQNAADAAALAGARLVRTNPTQARVEAQTFAGLNVGGTDDAGATSYVQLNLNSANAAAGDIVIGRWITTTDPPTFDPTHPSPNAMRVRAPRVEGSLAGAQRLFFGHLFDSSHANIKRTATAVTAGGLGAGLLVLDPRGTGPGDSALHLQGGPDLAVINGTIQVNSASSVAVLMQGSYTVVGEEMNIVGAMNNPPTTIPVNMGMPVIPDPLSWLIEPDPTGMSAINGNAGQTTLSPGYYPDGIDVGVRDITFEPGTYIIGTPLTPLNTTIFKLASNEGSIIAHGVTFFIAGGSLQWTGGAVTVSPPPLDQGFYYEHVTVFQARNNAAQVSITGNQNYHLSGTFYIPGRLDGTSGPLFDLNGTFGGSGGGIAEGVQVIAYRVRLGGTANLTLLFDGWWPGPLYSRVFLVE